MSASQHTTNYNFPKFLGTDKPAWLVDFNGAMDSIDSTIKTVSDVLTTVSGTVDTNTSDISQLITDLETASGNLSSLQSIVSQNVLDIATNENDISQLQLDVSNIKFLKNAIINGNFSVNQREKSGTVVLSAGQYGHDRWKAGASGCTYTFATVENVTTITITAGSLIQVIEGLNLETDTYTLAWEGTAQGKIGAGSYGASGLTGSVTGGTNLSIEFGVGSISKVRFNRGATPILWQTEAYADVFRQCQRYYYKMKSTSANANISFGYVENSTQHFFMLYLPTQLRTSVTLVEFLDCHVTRSGVGSWAATSISPFQNAGNVICISVAVASSTLTTNQNNALAFSTTSGYLAFGAEL